VNLLQYYHSDVHFDQSQPHDKKQTTCIDQSSPQIQRPGSQNLTYAPAGVLFWISCTVLGSSNRCFGKLLRSGYHTQQRRATEDGTVGPGNGRWYYYRGRDATGPTGVLCWCGQPRDEGWCRPKGPPYTYCTYLCRRVGVNTYVSSYYQDKGKDGRSPRRRGSRDSSTIKVGSVINGTSALLPVLELVHSKPFYCALPSSQEHK
jgi:hypothetical protein